MLIPPPTVLSPEGDFDIYSQTRFADALLPATEHRFVVLDFSRVRYIDSTCLSVLIRLHKRRAILGYPPAHIAGMNPLLRRVFALTRLDGLWPFFETVDEAIAGFSGRAGVAARYQPTASPSLPKSEPPA